MKELYVARELNNPDIILYEVDDLIVKVYKKYDGRYFLSETYRFKEKSKTFPYDFSVKSLHTLSDYMNNLVNYDNETNHVKRLYIGAYIENDIIQFEHKHFGKYDILRTNSGFELILTNPVNKLHTYFNFKIIRGDVPTNKFYTYYVSQYTDEFDRKVTCRESNGILLGLAKYINAVVK